MLGGKGFPVNERRRQFSLGKIRAGDRLNVFYELPQLARIQATASGSTRICPQLSERHIKTDRHLSAGPEL
jgi:hypothetical protein